MEGFLCPECKESFQTPGLLESHFNSHFQQDSGIRSILSKAKDYTLSWISNDEIGEGAAYNQSVSSSSPRTPRNVSPVHYLEDQLIGRAHNLTKVFKAVRPKKISHTQKVANKLHLRLDKLVTALVAEIQGSGKKNLKAVERSVVPWSDDSDTCVGCGEILSVLQLARKHHCRLCTGIICSNCSKFVPLTEAVEALERDVTEALVEQGHELRLCEKCQNIIQSAKEEIKLKNSDHSLEQNYRRLLEAREKCDELIQIYTKISNCLRSGDVTYTLDQGNMKRVELIKQFKVVDTISDRISNNRTDSPTQLKLQTNIKQSTRCFLQDNLPATTPLPETKDIMQIREKRLEESRAAVQQQKEAALRTQITHTTPSFSSNSGVKLDPQPSNTDSWSTKAKKEQISRDMARESSARAGAQPDSARAGWTGDVVQPQTRGHPLIEQREILRGYLRQAIRDDRREEVDTLKQNLLLILDEIKALGLEED